MASIDFEALGNEQKKYESISAGVRLIPGVPVIARLDGRAFHTLTKHANKPFDEALIRSMMFVTSKLVEEFNAEIGYQQSDEITLVWKSLDMFDGKVQKMVSVLASYATAVFIKAVNENKFLHHVEFPTFDCRIWQVASLEIAADNLMWREWDATKNSISMCAHHIFSDNMLKSVSSKDRLEMLYQHGYDWTELPDYKKRGSYWQKRCFMEFLSEEQLEKIPAQHRPAGAVSRNRVVMLEMPRLTQISNKVEVLFKGGMPVYENDI